jgi:hypothetical protein
MYCAIRNLHPLTVIAPCSSASPCSRCVPLEPHSGPSSSSLKVSRSTHAAAARHCIAIRPQCTLRLRPTITPKSRKVKTVMLKLTTTGRYLSSGQNPLALKEPRAPRACGVSALRRAVVPAGWPWCLAEPACSREARPRRGMLAKATWRRRRRWRTICLFKLTVGAAQATSSYSCPRACEKHTPDLPVSGGKRERDRRLTMSYRVSGGVSDPRQPVSSIWYKAVSCWMRRRESGLYSSRVACLGVHLKPRISLARDSTSRLQHGLQRSD